MTRNLRLAFFASMAFAASGCLGGFAPGQQGTPPSDNNTGTTPDPTTPPTTGGGGSTGGGGGGGGGTVTPPPASSAKPVFDANVAPIIAAKCASSGCHGGTGTSPPKFAAGTATTEYDTILNFTGILFPGFEKTTAQLVLKITGGNHNGMTYSAADLTAIDGWLDAEKTARASNPGTVSPRDALLAKFSGCMTQTDFDTAGVATAWANKTTDTTNTACQQCHVNASYFLANADSKRMFNILSTQANPQGGWFLEYFFNVDTTTDPANPKMIINRDYINRAATGLAQHEKFSIDTDRNGGTPSAYTRLTTFFTTTMSHMTAGTCGAPKLGTTPP